MKVKHFPLAVLAAVGALIVLGALMNWIAVEAAPAAPTATTRYVSAQYGADSGDCTSDDAPCKTIQYALNQSSDGDTIYVHAGTYTGTLQIDRSVTLQGGWGIWNSGGGLSWMRSDCHPESTVIDGRGTGRVIEIAANTAPVIDCFTITGGDATGLGDGPAGKDAGGGIYGQDAAPILINNIISGNVGSRTGTAYGGGIYLANASATALISNNVITHNTAASTTLGIGGGIFLDNAQAQVLSNTVAYNRASFGATGDGGGIGVEGGRPTLAKNVIAYNGAAQDGQGRGGGVYVRSSAPVTIEGNEIAWNWAMGVWSGGTVDSQGGGIYYAGDPTVAAVIRNNEIHDNTALPIGSLQGEGGGIYLSGLLPDSVVEGNRLWANYAGYNAAGRGGGIYVNGGELTLAHNVLSGNIATWTGDNGWGGGIYAEGGTLILQSNVITANLGGGFQGFPSTTTGWGGGIAVSDTVATLMGNTIVGNVGTKGDNAGAGGGVYGYGGLLTLQNNLITDNRASLDTNGVGGGVYLQETAPLLDSNLILRNAVTGTVFARGGGVRLAHCTPFTLTNNVIAENEASEQGSGIAVLLSDGVLAHNTIVQNDGGVGVGVEVRNGTVALSNTILVSHTVGITATSDATATLDGTLWWANGTDWGGLGSITTAHDHTDDPAFVRPSADNYHLRAGSAAIDNGVGTWVNTDMDGEVRPHGANPDLGADEYTCYARVVGGSEYPGVQQAVDAAPVNGTVQVAEGVCYENVAITENLTLEGGWNATFTSRYTDPAAHTTIDGAGLGRVVAITQATVAVDGFTLTGGDATGLGGSGFGYDVGGGLYGHQGIVTVANCVITHNVASRSTIGWGGGLGFYGGTNTISNTQVLSNVASMVTNGYGGGIYSRLGNIAIYGNRVEENLASVPGHGFGGGIAIQFTQVVMQGNVMRGNRAARAVGNQGGGLYLYHASARMMGDRLEKNSADVGGDAGYGGGLYAGQQSQLTAERIVVTGNRADNSGGGLYALASTLTLSNSHIYSNAAGGGGGIFLNDSDGALLTDNEVYSNTATYNGGGIHLWYSENGTLTGNRVFGNRAGWDSGGGGGITLRGNDLHDNQAEGGGGVHALSSSNLLLAENDIHENEGMEGGGISLLASGGEVRDNRIHHNRGGEGSSGVYIRSSGPVTLTANWIYANYDGSGVVWLEDNGSPIHLINNVIADNSANGDPGILVDNSEAHLVHNTLARNRYPHGITPDAIRAINGSRVAMTNTILVSHTVGIYVGSGTTATLEATLWGSGPWANGENWINYGTLITGTHNYWGDPAFLDPDADDYHIGAGSAALDRGVATGVNTDIDGEPRPMGASPDLGADEGPSFIFLPLILRSYP